MAHRFGENSAAAPFCGGRSVKRFRGAVHLNLIVIFGVAGLIAIAILLAMNQSAPEGTAEEFMQALAKKDVKKLVDLSYMENPSAPLQQQWDDCVNNKAKTYVFLWVWEGSRRESSDEAVMRIHLIE